MPALVGGCRMSVRVNLQNTINRARFLINESDKTTGKIDYSGLDPIMEYIFDIFPHPYHA